MVSLSAYAGPNRRLAKPSPLIVGLAALGAAGIAFATLCPQSLRPHMGDPDAERFAAFMILGALIALAAGRRWARATMAIVTLAVGLEAAQLIVPGRDAMLADAIIKAMGGVCGVASAQAFFILRRLALRFAGVLAARRRAEPALAG